MIVKKQYFFDTIMGDQGLAPGAQGQKYADKDDRRVLLALARSCNPKVVIEFGLNEGITAELLLREIKSITKYIGIDLPAEMETRLESQRTEKPTEPGELVVDDKRLKVLLKDSQTLTKKDLPKADFIFIDGGHDYETVKHDTDLAYELLKPGGVVCWHDYVHQPGIGVPRVIDEINATQGNCIALVEGTRVCYLRKKKTSKKTKKK